MSRGGTAAFVTALTGQVVRPAIFFEGVFGTGTVRFWSGLGDVVWAGQTWTGAGTLLGVSAIEEPTEVVAAGFTVSLSGVPLDLLAAVLDDVQQGDAGRIWLGLIDGAGALVADPVLAASGRLDQPVVSDDGQTCLIEVSYEGRLIDLFRPRQWRYTHESQQQVFPGDRGFEYVAGLQDKEIIWGAASPVGSAIAPARPSAGAAAAPQASPFRDASGAWIGSNGSATAAAQSTASRFRDAAGNWIGNPDT